MPQILKLSSSSACKRWDEYVRAHPQGSPFHLTLWRECILSVFRHPDFYFYTEVDGRITGVLPLFFVKSLLFGRILSSVPYAAYGGVLADDQETFDLLMEKGKSLAQEMKADYLEFKFFEKQPTALPESKIHYSFVKEISDDSEQNMMAIPRKQRRMVRVGIKAGLTAKVSGDFLDEFYEIFAENVRRLGTPVYPKAWFEKLLEVFGEESELMVVEHEGKIISGVISFYFNNTVLPFYAASCIDYRIYAPNDFQYWSLMESSRQKGCRLFDFGRSKIGTGHYSYKTHWGFEPTPLHYQYYLCNIKELPAINPLNPKFQWKIRAWRKLPIFLTKLIGPHIVKNIP